MKNFQAVKDADLEIEGLTVITGPSNRGKSSLLRAIAAAIFGASGDAFVRNGTDAASVGLKDEYVTIKWRKVAASKVTKNLMTAIEVNGTTYTKLGREHSELTAPFGFKEIRTKDMKLRPQVAMQHDPIFLLTSSENTVAEVFKELGRADVVGEAQKRVKTDKKTLEGTRQVREGDRLKLEEASKSLAYLQTLRGEADRLAQELSQTETTLKTLESALECLRKLKGLRLLDVPEPPRVELPTKVLATQVTVKRCKQLEPREVPPAIDLDAGGWDQNQKRRKAFEEYDRVYREAVQVLGERKILEEKRVLIEGELAGLRDRLGVCPVCERAFEGIHEEH